MSFSPKIITVQLEANNREIQLDLSKSNFDLLEWSSYSILLRDSSIPPFSTAYLGKILTKEFTISYKTEVDGTKQLETIEVVSTNKLPVYIYVKIDPEGRIISPGLEFDNEGAFDFSPVQMDKP